MHYASALLMLTRHATSLLTENRTANIFRRYLIDLNFGIGEGTSNYEIFMFPIFHCPASFYQKCLAKRSNGRFMLSFTAIAYTLGWRPFCS
jgi:hypothetical protein